MIKKLFFAIAIVASLGAASNPPPSLPGFNSINSTLSLTGGVLGINYAHPGTYTASQAFNGGLSAAAGAFTVDGSGNVVASQIQLPSGSPASPALAIGGTNTGLYANSGPILEVSVSGSLQAYWSIGAFVTFQPIVAPSMSASTSDGSQAVINFLSSGVQKWQLGKNPDNSFFLYDNVSNAQALSVSASGILSLGEPGTTVIATSLTAGAITASGSVVTAAAGAIAFSGTATASTSCGTLATAAGCIEINVAGTNRFVPFY